MSHDVTLSDEHRKTLGTINRSGEHLLTLINNVLDLAKIEAGKHGLEPEVFDLPHLLEETAHLMRLKAEAQGLELRLELHPDLPRAVSADQGKLRQVLINLLGNAVNFTLRGSVTLRAWTSPSDGGSRLVLEVEDTGIGIEAADQRRIFESFVQVAPQVSRQGTGLGLTITRQFIELMGGTVSVESVAGRGSTFRVEVPVGLFDQSLIPAMGDQGSRLFHLAPGEPPPKILVVEDQPENLHLMTQVLKQAGFQVQTAVDGSQAVAAFDQWRPALIWMDWKMPVMDGLEATRAIRARDGGQNVKIVVVSASVFQQERTQILAAGADDFLAKPLHLGLIYRCLGDQLGVKLVPIPGSLPRPSAVICEVDEDSLRALDPTLAADLTLALVSLDAERIAETLRRVTATNPALGEALLRYTARYQYTPILRALSREVAP
jgi:CheY-like chemotaxis protein/anti-sigma regulatory factor (Ser/Thr protein kinase)